MLAGIVLAHLVITIFHGAAHAKAQVPLSYLATVFVFAVILAGPLIGLAFMVFAQRVGAALIALTMGGALVFGLVNHFFIVSPDHVAHVDPRFRLAFLSTAVLLVFTEAAGFALAVYSTRVRRLI